MEHNLFTFKGTSHFHNKNAQNKLYITIIVIAHDADSTRHFRMNDMHRGFQVYAENKPTHTQRCLPLNESNIMTQMDPF